MQRLTGRFCWMGAAVLSLVIVASPPAGAGEWGGDGGGVIGVGVTGGGSSPGSPGSGGTAGGSPSSGGGGSSPWSCQYMYLALNNDGGFPPGGPEPGAWYSVTCIDSQNQQMVTQTVWVTQSAAPPGGPTPSVPPVDVAEQAENALRLPSPQIETSPAGLTFVNLATWLWIDPAIWHAYSVTASVGSVSATATATPIDVEWSTGDGGTVACAGPGTAYVANEPSTEQRTACSHVYESISSRYEVSATITWSVHWTAAGGPGGGPLSPLETASSRPIAVAQIESINSLASEGV